VFIDIIVPMARKADHFLGRHPDVGAVQRTAEHALHCVVRSIWKNTECLIVYGPGSLHAFVCVVHIRSAIASIMSCRHFDFDASV
jgi:hypothetical protein